MKFHYEKNYCSCHPETCCCHDFKIMHGKEKVATAFDEEKAKKLVELLNKESK